MPSDGPCGADDVEEKRRMIVRKNLVIGLVVVVGIICFGKINACAQEQTAQSVPAVSDQDIQLLRKDLRSMKKQLVAANMQLTDTEALKFWPLYDRYTQETIRINDARIALIKEYVTSYGKMTDAQAQSFTRRLIDVDDAVLRLRSKYVPLVQGVLPSSKTALFFQLDRRIGLLIDLQPASEIPMAQP
jgi:hypothetical protein